MSSHAKIDANRQNAKKSTGPKTKKGKAKSGLNAVKHGLFAQNVLLHDESEKDFMDLQQSLISELLPQGALEHQLVYRITGLLWRLSRISRIEAGVLAFEQSIIE